MLVTRFSVIQLMMPSLRQIGDFFSAVYAPYGEDEVADNRYDYSYSDDYKPYMQQFRNVRPTLGLLGRVLTRNIFSLTTSPSCLVTACALWELSNLRPAYSPLS